MSCNIEGESEQLIQPLQQKMFEFKLKEDTKLFYSKNNSLCCHGWKPILNSKKLQGEPKFILSLQRKKARIISALRDKQIENNQEKLLGLVGGKVKNISYISQQSKSKIKQRMNIQQFVRSNQNKLNQIQFKKKKNPNMSFSLLYMTESKKQIERQIEGTYQKRIHSARFGSVGRQKGSNNLYLHMAINQMQTHKKQQLNRPKTSFIRKPNLKDYRSQSQIL